MIEQRRDEFTKIEMQFPDRIPIVCEKYPGSSIGGMDKSKFVPFCDIPSVGIW